MRIGVDATCCSNMRGYGRHARALLSTLVHLDHENHYVFFADSTESTRTFPRHVETRVVETKNPTVLAASANGHRSIRNMCRMSRAMSDREIDLLLFPTIYSYVPVFSRAKKVVLIHDVIPEKYPDLTVPGRAARFFWNTKVAVGRRQADAIVTVSDYSRLGILEHFGLAPERVFVVGEASDPIFQVLDDPQPSDRLRSLGIRFGNRLVVYVGGFGPHKNLEKLIAGFAGLASQMEFSDLHLVMVGEFEKEVFHSYYRTIKRRVQEFGITDRVTFTGYLADEDLVILLNLATVLVLPSLIEGFGLPAIEAAACGCPVIATKASPLSNLLGEGALYIDPSDDQDLPSALERVLASAEVRRQMRAAGVVAARRLSWEAAARQLINVFEQVVAK